MNIRGKIRQIILESTQNVFYHGSTDKGFHGKKGIHIGTKLAATQALEARIGVPAEGEWDGTREYGKTLLAGSNSLKRISSERGEHCETGYNCVNVPKEDYYPTQREDRATYSDGSAVSFNSKPIVFPVEIIGRMTNNIWQPHKDAVANGMIMRNIRKGNARSGYYYINDAEDEGSISAVVPDGSFLRVI